MTLRIADHKGSNAATGRGTGSHKSVAKIDVKRSDISYVFISDHGRQSGSGAALRRRRTEQGERKAAGGRRGLRVDEMVRLSILMWCVRVLAG
jgi:hypothetical protein